MKQIQTNYLCPNCFKDKLVYDEKDRLFLCNNCLYETPRGPVTIIQLTLKGNKETDLKAHEDKKKIEKLTSECLKKLPTKRGDKDEKRN